MLQGQVPHGEGLELGVSSLHAALVLVVDLAQTRGELARARAGCRNDYERTVGYGELVFAKALVAYDEGGVCWVAVDGVVSVALHTHAFQTPDVCLGMGLAGVARDDDLVCQQAHATKHVHEPEHVLVVPNAYVATTLVLLDVLCVDGYQHLGIIGECREHACL